MASNVAPPKSTGGGGFVFEDQVCAWLLACMLADDPPLDAAHGRLERIDFQARVDGWFLDDAVLTLAHAAARARCALSIKSDSQFAVHAAPIDFVKVAWEQFLREGSVVFDPATDLLGLVTAPLEAETRLAVEGIVTKAIAEDPLLLPSRMPTKGWTNDAERELFNSFACPVSLASKHAITTDDTGKLLRRVRFLQFDFDAATSESKKAAIRLCRSSLRSGDLEDATKLWDALLRIASELRPKSGFMTRVDLLDRLRGRFNLHDRPDHRTDWQRLTELSRATATEVPDEIADRVRIPRDDVLANIGEALDSARGLVLLGPSGTGKSATARRWLERRAEQGKKTLWFDGRSFERMDYAAFEADLRLSHALSELMPSVGDSDTAVVLDGLDRIYLPGAFQLVAQLVRLLALDRSGAPWRIVVTCQTQEWSRLQDSLLQARIQTSTWRVVELPAFNAAALSSVGAAFPAVAKLVRQQRLGPVLSNLKILDMVARRSSAGEDVETTKWVGESSVAAWFWESEITRGKEGPIRGRFVRLLAERQADALRPSISPDVFQVGDLQPLGNLVVDRICRHTPDEQIAFAHDLYGDWARLRILVSSGEGLAEFIKKRLESPLWHRALRLFGLHLLEHVGDVDRWRSALRAVSGDENGIAQDLLLEAPIFAAEPGRLLELIASDLLNDDGKLLRRLLSRFLAYATLPDPQMIAIARAERLDEATARVKYRYPNLPYWPAVLRFLHTHRVDVVEAAPVEVARVAELWLQHVPVKIKLLRREAGELALALGERARRFRDSYSGGEYRQRGLYYRVALAAAAELPDEVAGFALQASERLADEDVEEEGSEELEPSPLPMIMQLDPRFNSDEPAPEPWPGGPRRRIDDEFRNAVLEGSALVPLMFVRPAIAREVALAVLIKPPRRFEWQHRYGYERTELDLDSGHRWHPALYIHGPFLALLRINFPEGLELIAQLVDFATQRWIHYATSDADEAARRRDTIGASSIERMLNQWDLPPGVLRIDLDGGGRNLNGDARVYGWSAGLGNPPPAVEAALMALEQYFYRALDEKKPIEAEVRAVLNQAHSVALLKVLCDVGKREPALFEGPLRPLLAVPEIYDWDIDAEADGRTLLMFGAPMQGAWFVKLAKAFYELKHRKIDLRRLALLLFFDRPAMREFFDSARSVWEQRMKAAPEDPLCTVLEQLIINFDLRNYEAQEDPEHGPVHVNVRVQQRDQERADERRAWEEEWFVTSLPMRCRRMIDEAKPLEPHEIEAFWRQLRQIDEKFGQDSASADQVGKPYGVVNAVAGGIAVIVRFHAAWLAEAPERGDWCRRRIQEIVLEPPAGAEFDTPESVTTWTWDCFAAEVIPLLWSSNPGEQVLRGLIARLVFAPHYTAVEILFRRCAENRTVLGADFGRLRRLAFECAYIRDRLVFVRNGRHALGHIEEDDFRKFVEATTQWEEECVDAFVLGTSEARWERWADLDTHRFRVIDDARRAWGWDDHLDLLTIRAAHAWMPILANAVDASERREWVEYWREALAFVLRRPAKAGSRREQNYPYEDEQWVLTGAAAAVLHMAPDEHPDTIWTAVLDLQVEAHSWPESFFQAFHRAALSSDPTPQTYGPILRMILNQVLPRDSREAIKWPYHEEVWDALVGLDGLTRSCWETRHAALVSSLSDVFERWWQSAPTYGRRTALFARWLESSAASPIRLRGIRWIEQRLSADGGRAFDREDTSDAIASLLNVTWQHDEARLRSDGPAIAAFWNLLRALADEQNALALDLLGRIGGLA